MRSSRRVMIGVLVGIGALYVGAAWVTRSSYRRMLYPAPEEGSLEPPAEAELITTRAADGPPVHVLYWPARREGARTVVHFHGNGETIGASVGRAEALAARGVGVALVEYRGYGVSASADRATAVGPTEQGLYLDAEAALDALAARGIAARDVTLWGTSLGTGVAVEMARRGRGSALVLITPYTSVPAMAARFVPFLPTRFLVADAFDNLAKAPDLRLPTLVVHGDHDELIPFAMGQTIAAAIPGSRMWTVDGGMHNDLFLRTGTALIDAIAAMPPAR